jgi:hypothetical protein
MKGKKKEEKEQPLSLSTPPVDCAGSTSISFFIPSKFPSKHAQRERERGENIPEIVATLRHVSK